MVKFRDELRARNQKENSMTKTRLCHYESSKCPDSVLVIQYIR